jgi:hypothetical protein
MLRPAAILLPLIRVWFAVAIGLAVLQTGPGLPRVSAAGTLVFRVKAAELGLQDSTFAKRASPTGYAELSEPGELYTQPMTLLPVTRAQARRSSPEAAAQGDFSAQRTDDRGWIVENFAPSERAAVQGMVADPKLFAANQDIMVKRSVLKIHGRVEYKGFAVLVVGYDDAPERHYPLVFVPSGGAWYRTNALSRDEGFDVIFTAVTGRGSVIQK